MRILRWIEVVSTGIKLQTILHGASNSLGYFHCTPLQPPDFNLRYSLPSLKGVLAEPLVKLVTLPDEWHGWRDTCRRIQWVVGALVSFPLPGLARGLVFHQVLSFERVPASVSPFLHLLAPPRLRLRRQKRFCSTATLRQPWDLHVEREPWPLPRPTLEGSPARVASALVRSGHSDGRDDI